ELPRLQVLLGEVMTVGAAACGDGGHWEKMVNLIRLFGSSLVTACIVAILDHFVLQCEEKAQRPGRDDDGQ
ncbi:unnamed protein product, partial [Cladocopium goreaui]